MDSRLVWYTINHIKMMTQNSERPSKQNRDEREREREKDKGKMVGSSEVRVLNYYQKLKGHVQFK